MARRKTIKKRNYSRKKKYSKRTRVRAGTRARKEIRSRRRRRTFKRGGAEQGKALAAQGSGENIWTDERIAHLRALRRQHDGPPPPQKPKAASEAAKWTPEKIKHVQELQAYHDEGGQQTAAEIRRRQGPAEVVHDTSGEGS